MQWVAVGGAAARWVRRSEGRGMGDSFWWVCIVALEGEELVQGVKDSESIQSAAK